MLHPVVVVLVGLALQLIGGAAWVAWGFSFYLMTLVGGTILLMVLGVAYTIISDRTALTRLASQSAFAPQTVPARASIPTRP